MPYCQLIATWLTPVLEVDENNWAREVYIEKGIQLGVEGLYINTQKMLSLLHCGLVGKPISSAVILK